MLANHLKLKQKKTKGKKKRLFLGMLSGTLASSSLWNLLTGKGKIIAGEGTIRGGQDFEYRLILYGILKYKNIIKMNLNLMGFIQEVIYLK